MNVALVTAFFAVGAVFWAAEGNVWLTLLFGVNLGLWGANLMKEYL